jgi:hypothetical protein
MARQGPQHEERDGKQEKRKKEEFVTILRE